MPEQTDRTVRAESTRQRVREHYAAAARRAGGDPATDTGDPQGCCAPADGIVLPVEERDRFGAALYGEVPDDLPVSVVGASLGCGDPVTVADLHEGEVVLDLGSGAGLDVLLSARRVGPTGHAYGLDMTEDMLSLARDNARRAGADNVTFLAGEIEAIPLPDAAVDVALSNCVINLSEDKGRVLAELARVVRPGGRLAISDVVAEDHLSPAERAERGSVVGCIAGAMSRAEYLAGLESVGFRDVEVAYTHEVADGMHAAVVRGVRSTTP